jgi:ABC-type uncharacterized transport system ATPase subunit
MDSPYGRRGADIVIWLLLLTMPYWLTAVGGYTQLGSRVIIMALAATSLNFLLGYTGVLSFGHAAYFGLGAYGMGLTIKYLVPSTFAGMAVGVLTGAAAAAIIGVLIVHLRGIYLTVRARVSDLLDMGGLSGKADRLVGELAHGDQRATEIMMALALKPRLLLLDEPTAGMGDQETYEITRLILRMHKDSKLTIVLIEHDMRVVFHLADRITVLDQGSFLAEGTPREIAANEAVQTAYLGQAA